jgi:hypothetical protein
MHMAEKGLSWKQCSDICTDGSRSMVAKKHIAHVTAVAPECVILVGLLL